MTEAELNEREEWRRGVLLQWGGVRIPTLDVYGPGSSGPIGTGFVELVDVMGDDARIAAAARLSYSGGKSKAKSSDEGLIRYLMRHRHTSPTEMASITLHLKMPIFVARQLVRHRTACLAGETLLHFDLPGAEKRGRYQRHNVSIADFVRIWTEGTKHDIAKKKPAYTEDVDASKMYTVPELSTIVKRNKDTIRNMIRLGYLEAQKVEVSGPKEPSIRISGQAWHDFAARTHQATVPMQGRLSKMKLRSVDEETGEVQYTHVTDCWASGEKTVYRLRLRSGIEVKMSEDHRILTDQGWKRLRDLLKADVLPNVATIQESECRAKRTDIVLTEEELRDEEWREIQGFERKYEVSSLGRVRSLLNTRGGELRHPKIKKPTSTGGYQVVGLSTNSITRTYQVHCLVLSAFSRSPERGECGCHEDGNGLDNRLSNLRWDRPKGNFKDRVRHGTSKAIRRVYEPVESILEAGVEMTYDLEVEGPYHNFSANGMIVHNSLNEMSGRYSILPNEFYVPPEDQVCVQAVNNKQGRAEPLPSAVVTEIRKAMWRNSANAFTGYSRFIDSGLAKETARMQLPVSTYTEWWWTFDAHNLLHMLGLRMDTHAQWECRVYANAIAQIVEAWLPITWKAFRDYRLDAQTLSGPEIRVLRQALAASNGAVRDSAEVRALSAENGVSEREVDGLLRLLGLES